MSQPFVPFLAKAPPKTGSVGESFRLTVLPQLHDTHPFLPAQVGPTGGGAPPCAKEPVITLERDGDRITLIKIQCICGQVVELNCAY